MKRLTPIIALMSVFMLACCFVVFGASAENIKATLGVGAAEIGLILSVFLYTAMVVQFFIGAVTDRIGHKPIALVGFIVTGVCMFLISAAVSMSLLLTAAVLLGIGAMCLNTVGNTIIPQVLFEGKDPARASNFGNGFFGLGLFVTPLIINYFPSAPQGGLIFLAAINAFLLILSLFTVFPKANLGYKFSTGFKLLGQAPVFIAALALLCYIGLENSMNGWIAQYMTELFRNTGFEGPLAMKRAGTVLSAFGLSMAIGRFITAGVKNLTATGVKLIIAVSAVAAVSIFVMYLTSSPIIAIVAVIVTGLSFAPVFPTVVGVTFSKYEPQYYGSIFGMIFAIGLFGGGILQNLIGGMAGESVQSSLFIPAIVAIILLLVALFMGKAKAKPVD